MEGENVPAVLTCKNIFQEIRVAGEVVHDEGLKLTLRLGLWHSFRLTARLIVSLLRLPEDEAFEVTESHVITDLVGPFQAAACFIRDVCFNHYLETAISGPEVHFTVKHRLQCDVVDECRRDKERTGFLHLRTVAIVLEDLHALLPAVETAQGSCIVGNAIPLPDDMERYWVQTKVYCILAMV